MQAPAQMHLLPMQLHSNEYHHAYLHDPSEMSTTNGALGAAQDAHRFANSRASPEAQLVQHHQRPGGDDAAHAAALDDQPQLGVVGALPRAAAGLGAPPRQLDRRVRDL